MVVLEFAGIMIVAIMSIWALASVAIRLHERHVEWKYQLEKRKKDDEINYRLIDEEKK